MSREILQRSSGLALTDHKLDSAFDKWLPGLENDWAEFNCLVQSTEEKG
jgi:hypothetical protein